MFEGTGIRIASIIVGLLFIIGLVVVANRFGQQLRSKLQSRISSTQVTPSPQIPTGSPDVDVQAVSGDNSGNFYNVNSTPAAGAEMLVYPILLASLGLGLKLRKTTLK